MSKQKQKGLTLQQYIECHNIKKQLKQRSKQKQRQKSIQKSQTTTNNNNNNTLSLQAIEQSTLNLRQSIINQSLYDKVDTRAKNLNKQLQQMIKQIKIQCRAYIHKDKQFAAFIRLLDKLMDKFRFQVMRIHKQNIALFKVSQTQLNITQQKDEVNRSRLQKSLNEQYQQSKHQYQQHSLKQIIQRKQSQSSKKNNNKREQQTQQQQQQQKQTLTTKRNNNHIITVNVNDNNNKPLNNQHIIISNTNNKDKLQTIKSLPIQSNGTIIPVNSIKHYQQEDNIIQNINQLTFSNGFFNNNRHNNNIKMNNESSSKQIKQNLPVIMRSKQSIKATNTNKCVSKSPSIINKINTILPKSPPSRKSSLLINDHNNNNNNKLLSSTSSHKNNSKTPNKRVKSKNNNNSKQYQQQKLKYKQQKDPPLIKYQTIRTSQQYLTSTNNNSKPQLKKKITTTSTKSKQKHKKSSSIHHPHLINNK